MRDKLYRFMAGRNGMDQLGQATGFVALVLILINIFVRGLLLELVILALLTCYCFRVFSRNLARRQEENSRYLRWEYAATSAVRGWWDRMKQRRDYAFFRCPECRARLRVPRGKGRVRVTCRKCGNAFERRT